MFRTVLVPFDGSSFGDQAVPMAVAIARRTGATLHLLHVHVPAIPLSAMGEVSPLSIDPAWEREGRERERAHLTEVADGVREQERLQVAATLLDGIVPDAILAHAGDIDADLIVMATHGRGGVSRAWLGSVADEIMRRTTIPVLLVRPEAVEGEAPRIVPSLGRVLVPLDGSPLAEQVLDAARSLAEATDGELVLLRVTSPPYLTTFAPDAPIIVIDDQMLAAEREEATRYLDHIAAELREAGLRVETMLVQHARPAQAILVAAANARVGTVAIATHGRGGLARLFLGSVADKVIRGGSRTTLVVRPAHVPVAAPARAVGAGTAAVDRAGT